MPRLSTAWDGNPLLPLIDELPEPRRHGAGVRRRRPAAARPACSTGSDRFPVNAPVDFTRRCRTPAAWRPMHALCSRSWWRPARPLQALGDDPPRLAEPVKTGDLHQEVSAAQLPRSRFCSPGRGRPTPSPTTAITARSRRRRHPNPAFETTPDTVSWGQVYAYCLRHHQLARRLGLIREASFDGRRRALRGWRLRLRRPRGRERLRAQAAADIRFLARYAARIPRLVPGTADGRSSRPCSFPCSSTIRSRARPASAPGNYDAVFVEAADYDDGFAKIVHGTQPVSQNLLAEDPDGFAPLTDIGIRLGWDDEQILIWQNRQLKEDPTVPKVAGKAAAARRADGRVRLPHRRTRARRRCVALLVHVRSKAPLVSAAIPLGDPPDEAFVGELGVEVHPQQLDGNQATGQFWLPAYLAQWNGKSLVLPDEDAAEIFKTEQADGQAADAWSDVYAGRPASDPAAVRQDLRLPRPADGPDRRRTGRDRRAGQRSRRRRSRSVPFLRHVVPEPVPHSRSARSFPTPRSTPFYAADDDRGEPSPSRLPERRLHRKVRRSRSRC